MAFSSPRFEAWRDLLRRYAMVFRHAWQRRAEFEPVPRLPHEAQFLPAALSLQETPVSPTPRLAMWLLISFAALALLWAIFGRIDVVATAQGKIEPNDQTKIIQPFETATVKAIHVRDGQEVRAGELLIELDATLSHADQQRIQSDLTQARLQAARGQALLQALDQAVAPRLDRVIDVDDASFARAQAQLAGQWAEYLARQRQIDDAQVQHQAEWASAQVLLHKFEQTVPIAQQRARDYKGLLDRQFVSRHGFLEQEKDRIEQEAGLIGMRSRLKEIEAMLRANRSQRLGLLAETRRINLEEVAEGLQKAAALEQELRKADSRKNLMRLTSPVDGTVQQLAVW